MLDIKTWNVQIICGIAILSYNISDFYSAVLKRESYPWSLVQAVQYFVQSIHLLNIFLIFPSSRQCAWLYKLKQKNFEKLKASIALITLICILKLIECSNKKILLKWLQMSSPWIKVFLSKCFQYVGKNSWTLGQWNKRFEKQYMLAKQELCLFS